VQPAPVVKVAHFDPSGSYASLRLLHVTQAYYPFLDAGGPAAKVRAIAKGLAQRGHHVTVLTTDLGFGRPGGPVSPAEQNPWGWRIERDGVETTYLRTWARYRALTLNPGVLSFARGQLGGFDLVHIYGLYDLLGSTVGHFCLRRGIPYVIEPMGMYRPIVRNLWLKQMYRHLLGERLVKCSRRVVATSQQEARELVEEGISEAQVFVRRNGIELPHSLPERGRFRKQWGIAPQTKLILFLGRLVSKKSPDLLLEAYACWRETADKGVASMVALAGPEEGDGYLGKIKTLSQRLGLGDSVLFTGPLYDDAKWAAYRDADVFVLPSQHENFGNTAAEAISCGTPVIITDRCGIAPLVNGRAGIVIPHNLADLAAALGRLLGDERLRQQFRSGSEEATQELSWDEPLTQMEDLYRELVAGSDQR
jgi:glycosyltransferase involved in cell wall biosynthesis